MIDNWIDQFQLFLFDFDGLLVNTEKMHYRAYQEMCRTYGVELTWSFEHYCTFAHYHSAGFKEAIFSNFPELEKKQPDWSVLYEEKKQALTRLFLNEQVPLMPGVEEFLGHLKKAEKKAVVVTHSPKKLIDIVRAKNPHLEIISHWITREDYTHPKPDPECYKIAVDRFSKKGDRVVGFEDTPRGLRALMPTGALPLLIAEIDYPEIPTFIEAGAKRYHSFTELISDFD